MITKPRIKIWFVCLVAFIYFPVFFFSREMNKCWLLKKFESLSALIMLLECCFFLQLRKIKDLLDVQI